MRIDDIFEIGAEELWAKRESGKKIHGNNISAAGNQSQISFNKWLDRVTPNNVRVLSGHIVGKNKEISPQIDTIITDSQNISSLFTSEDGTNYVPISSVYAVGEIKSTFTHAKQESGKSYIDKFVENKEIIDEKLGHVLEVNTMFDGQTKNPLLEHMVFNSTSPWMNKIFHFLFCFSKGTAKLENLKKEFQKNDKKYLPNLTVMMDSYSIFYCNKEYKAEKYPEYIGQAGSWVLNPFDENPNCSQMANNLGFFYYLLMQHINNSLLNDRDILPYFESFILSKKSTIISLS
ncbi:MAG: hypothetical protein JXN65_01955 [Clostridia bacterium]|nr:hypothetical protein [Clostridia bacterium]